VSEDTHFSRRRANLEIPVVGGEPCIDDPLDLKSSLADVELTWRFLATVTGVAFDYDRESGQIGWHLGTIVGFDSLLRHRERAPEVFDQVAVAMSSRANPVS